MTKTDPKALLKELRTLRTLLVDEETGMPLQDQADTNAEPTGAEAAPETDDLFAPTLHADADVPDTDAPDLGAEAGDDLDVPVLEDVVDGAISVNETLFSRRTEAPVDDDGPIGLDDAAIEALLADEWQEATKTVLDDARSRITEAPDAWTPQDTDELNHALKIRIDDTVREWIRETFRQHIDELRGRLRTVIAREISEQIDDKLNPRGTEDPDHG